MTQEEKKTAQSTAQTPPGGKALAGTICILTLLFVLAFLFQSLGEFRK
jgi:hypothetical protein